MTVAIQSFAVPTRDSISEANRAIFDKLKAGLGFVPNLYAAFAHSETALGDYLALQGRRSSLSLWGKRSYQSGSEPSERMQVLFGCSHPTGPESRHVN